MKILKLTAENVKRLSVVEITPNGAPVIVIAGENEAGKSSVLDAIAYALGGKKLLPAKPIRDGQTRAAVTVDLGEYRVTRTFTAAGSALTVTNPKGLEYPSPQALLDGLVGKLTFDPLAFATADDKAQADTLRQLAGVDTTDLETKRKQLFEERTLINRDAAQAQGALTKAVQHADVGLDLVDVSDIVDALASADELANSAVRLASIAQEASTDITRSALHAVHCTEAIDRARQALEDAETASLLADERVQQAREKHETALSAAAAATVTVPDRAALRQQMADVAATNGKIRDNVARQALVDLVATKKRESDALTLQIAVVDNQKATRLSAAKFPIPGLGLDDAGVTWGGLPFAQASTAVRVRASVAIGLALNPKLKVLLVRNGNDLGKANLQLLADAAAAADAQLWVERIAGGDGQPTVVIEDGSVAVESPVLA